MGYIFDALNKSDDADQKDRKIDSPQSPASDAEGTESPLRLDDILARHGQAAEPSVEESNANQVAESSPDTCQPMWEPSDPDQVFAQGGEGFPSVSETLASLPTVQLEADSKAPELEADCETGEAENAASTSSAQDDAIASSPFRLPGLPEALGCSRPWYRFWTRSPLADIDDRLVVLTDAASGMAEEYRSIRTSILARHQNERHVVHTITSATPQEGKTITCLNLGLAFAELHNRKTIIVECDLRLPSFEKLLTLNHQTGLVPYLNGEVSLADSITRIPGTGSNLDVMTAAGQVSDEAVQMLSSSRLSQLIETLRAKYDHVIIDTPPVVDLADAGILGAQGDEVLLVARMRRTPQELVEQAVRTLHSYNAEVGGMIATDNPRSRGRGYGYGYHYGYGYGYNGKRRSRRRYAA